MVEEFGRLDILVNNAGVNTSKHRVTIDEFPREEWDRILAVDLTGLYEVSQAAARVMRSRGSGRIINIASIVGLVPAAAAMRLRRRQGGRGQPDQGHGPGTWAARHPGQRRRPRLHPHRRNQAALLRPDGQFKDFGAADARPRAAWAGRARPTRSPWRSCSWPTRRTATPRPHPRPSTAAGRPATPASFDRLSQFPLSITRVPFHFRGSLPHEESSAISIPSSSEVRLAPAGRHGPGDFRRRLRRVLGHGRPAEGGQAAGAGGAEPCSSASG